MPAFSPTILSLIEICNEAGAVAERLQRPGIEASFKDGGDIVTAADLKSHEIIRARLDERFPGVAVVMEEQANPPKLPAAYIAADELDGTAVYCRGMREWGVALALIENGAPIAGVIALPALATIIAAERGAGAWVNGEAVRLDSKARLGSSMASVEVNRRLTDREFAWVRAVARSAAGVRGLGATAGNLLDLLLGRTKVFMNARGGRVWDFAAGYVALTEAGGAALGCGGEALRWDSAPMGVVMGHNRAIVEEVLALSPGG